MNIIEQALQKITEKQSKFNESDKRYWIAEQVKDICRENEDNAHHIYNDLDDEQMSIKKIEERIANYAKKHGGCCPPQPADKIIREFFGLAEPTEKPAEPKNEMIDLADFLV